MKGTSVSSKPIDFKGATLGVMTARLRDTDPMRLADAMHAMLGGMPDFFNREAAVMDFSGLEAMPDAIDWASLTSLLRRYRLQPVAVTNLPEAFEEGARRAGLAVIDAAGEVTEVAATAAEPIQQPTAPAPAPTQSGEQLATVVIQRPLRSGQQAYAKDSDLILLGGVSPGAEVIADGHIHCYGPLRGRALAGAQGNGHARIFATDFGPELVSIAGVYRTFEKGIPENVGGKPAHAWLSGDEDTQTLMIAPL